MEHARGYPWAASEHKSLYPNFSNQLQKRGHSRISTVTSKSLWWNAHFLVEPLFKRGEICWQYYLTPVTNLDNDNWSMLPNLTILPKNYCQVWQYHLTLVAKLDDITWQFCQSWKYYQPPLTKIDNITRHLCQAWQHLLTPVNNPDNITWHL